MTVCQRCGRPGPPATETYQPSALCPLCASLAPNSSLPSVMRAYAAASTFVDTWAASLRNGITEDAAKTLRMGIAQLLLDVPTLEAAPVTAWDLYAAAAIASNPGVMPGPAFDFADQVMKQRKERHPR